MMSSINVQALNYAWFRACHRRPTHLMPIQQRYRLTTGKGAYKQVQCCSSGSIWTDPCQHKLLRFLRPKDSFVVLPLQLQTQ
jgi:hypothetical protein